MNVLLKFGTVCPAIVSFSSLASFKISLNRISFHLYTQSFKALILHGFMCSVLLRTKFIVSLWTYNLVLLLCRCLCSDILLSGLISVLVLVRFSLINFSFYSNSVFTIILVLVLIQFYKINFSFTFNSVLT